MSLTNINSGKLQQMDTKQIATFKSFKNKRDIDTVRIEFTDKTSLFLSEKQVINLLPVGNLHALTNGSLTYEFYSKGDKDFRDQEITQDDTIVKSDTLAFTPSDTFTKLLLAQSAGLTAIAV